MNGFSNQIEDIDIEQVKNQLWWRIDRPGRMNATWLCEREQESPNGWKTVWRMIITSMIQCQMVMTRELKTTKPSWRINENNRLCHVRSWWAPIRNLGSLTRNGITCLNREESKYYPGRSTKTWMIYSMKEQHGVWINEWKEILTESLDRGVKISNPKCQKSRSWGHCNWFGRSRRHFNIREGC